MGKLDVDFHERGYELIHVPAGRDNADKAEQKRTGNHWINLAIISDCKNFNKQIKRKLRYSRNFRG